MITVVAGGAVGGALGGGVTVGGGSAGGGALVVAGGVDSSQNQPPGGQLGLDCCASATAGAIHAIKRAETAIGLIRIGVASLRLQSRLAMRVPDASLHRDPGENSRKPTETERPEPTPEPGL